MVTPTTPCGVVQFDEDDGMMETIKLDVESSSALRANGWSESNNKITWEVFFWWTWVIGTLIWTVDRLAWNCWPRESFGEGFGSDKSPLTTELTSTTIYNVLIRATGRLCTCTLSGLLVTSFREVFTFLQRLQDKRVLNFINFYGWAESNYRSHVILGKFIGVLTIVHVVVIFLPVVLSGWSHVIYRRGPTTLPLSETKTCPDFDYQLHVICLSTDDIIRFVLTLIVFLLIFPMSQSKLISNSNYNTSRFLHLFGSLWYCIDITRKKTHPHTWIINIPIIVLLLIDRIFSWWLSKQTRATILQLDHDYLILELNDFNVDTETVAPTINLSLTELGKADYSHRLTVVSQCCKKKRRCYSEKEHKFDIAESFKEPLMPSDDTNPLSASTPSRIQRRNSVLQCVTEEENQVWNPANPFMIVRVSKSETDPSSCTFLNKRSATAILASGNPVRNVCVGVPVCSVYHQLLFIEGMPPVILIASGSGASMLLDFMYYVVKNKISLLNNVKIFYTSRSLPLFQFVTDMLCEESVHNLEVSAALTAPGYEYSPSHPTRDMQIGRMHVSDMLSDADSKTQVFFCGSYSLQKELTTLCNKYSLKLKHSHAFEA